MSYVEIHRVQANGEVVSYDSAKNNHGFAPIVWDKLAAQYKIPIGSILSEDRYNKVWEAYGTGTFTAEDNILMGATFDRSWIPRESLPLLLKAMRDFHARVIVPNNYVHTILDSVEIIEDLLKEDPEIRGVAFTMCSAVQTMWRLHVTGVDEDGEEYEETRNLNIDTDVCYDGKPPQRIES